MPGHASTPSRLHGPGASPSRCGHTLWRQAMAEVEPVGELHEPFSSEGALATPWKEARMRLEKAEVFWLSTVRPDGPPHVTPMVSVWLDGALYFSTGRTERKAQHLAGNAHCII